MAKQTKAEREAAERAELIAARRADEEKASRARSFDADVNATLLRRAAEIVTALRVACASLGSLACGAEAREAFWSSLGLPHFSREYLGLTVRVSVDLSYSDHRNPMFVPCVEIAPHGSGGIGVAEMGARIAILSEVHAKAAIALHRLTEACHQANRWTGVRVGPVSVVHSQKEARVDAMRLAILGVAAWEVES